MKSSLSAAVAAAAALLAAGCGDMRDDARIKPYEDNAFFADGMSARRPPEGTVPVEIPGARVETPVAVTRELLERGRQRYDIFCSVCHDRAGDGSGMIVRRGFKKPPSLHERRLVDAPDSHLYSVIAKGFGVMPDYSHQVPERDRWAIVAYVRALQQSRRAPAASLTDAERAKLEAAP